MESLRVGHTATNTRLGSRVRWRLLAIPLLILATVVSLLYLSQTSDVATTGYDIADLEAQKRELQMRNEQLRLQIAQLQSLDRVEHEAATRLQMGPPRHVVYVTAPVGTVPPPTPTAVATPTVPGENPLVGLWQLIDGARSAAR